MKYFLLFLLTLFTFTHSQIYTHCFRDLSTDFTLRWNITPNGNLTMRAYLPLAGSGWGAIGFNEKGKGMPGAYIILGFKNEINEYIATDYEQPTLLPKQNLFDHYALTAPADPSPAYRNPKTALWMYFSRNVKVDNETFEFKNETQMIFIAFNDYQIPTSNTSFMKHTTVYIHELNLFEPSMFKECD